MPVHEQMCTGRYARNVFNRRSSEAFPKSGWPPNFSSAGRVLLKLPAISEGRSDEACFVIDKSSHSLFLLRWGIWAETVVMTNSSFDTTDWKRTENVLSDEWSSLPERHSSFHRTRTPPECSVVVSAISLVFFHILFCSVENVCFLQ